MFTKAIEVAVGLGSLTSFEVDLAYGVSSCRGREQFPGERKADRSQVGR